MSHLEEIADLAWSVTVDCLAEVLGGAAIPLEPETEITDLKLDQAACSRLSALLVERAGGYLSPMAVVVCTTVGELHFLVERIMTTVAGKRR